MKNINNIKANPAAGRIEYLMDQYLTHLAKERCLSVNTVHAYKDSLGAFKKWAQSTGLVFAIEISERTIENYQKYLYQHRKSDGQTLCGSTYKGRLSRLKLFLGYLVKRGHILFNPAADLVLPKTGRKLPRYVLTAKEAERLMQAPDTKNATGIRDRAILEVLYSTGIRKAELLNLCVEDVDFSRGIVAIRHGKGAKDRVIPISERALYWVENYLKAIGRKGQGYRGRLFLNKDGEPCTKKLLGCLVHTYLIKADIQKTGSCHLLRHSMATLMLEGGADLRYIQEMLGHASITSTQIYTHVAAVKLKDVHKHSRPDIIINEELKMNNEK